MDSEIYRPRKFGNPWNVVPFSCEPRTINTVEVILVVYVVQEENA